VTQFAELSTAEWDAIVSVNLNGPFYVLSAATPLLRDNAGVVTVASVAAQTGAPHHAHYAAAKAGLVNLTKSAARALAPGVRVNCVSPGVTLTPMGRDTAANLAPDYAAAKLLAGRFADPDEIARAIVFLASPAVGFITGATLDVNGGRGSEVIVSRENCLPRATSFADLLPLSASSRDSRPTTRYPIFIERARRPRSLCSMAIVISSPSRTPVPAKREPWT
jgi:enoyl-[acyl-carrier-protein] reductase (NADH)